MILWHNFYISKYVLFFSLQDGAFGVPPYGYVLNSVDDRFEAGTGEKTRFEYENTRVVALNHLHPSIKPQSEVFKKTFYEKPFLVNNKIKVSQSNIKNFRRNTKYSWVLFLEV